MNFPKLFITDPLQAARMVDSLLPFDIELMVLHGSIVYGNFSEKSDVDMIVAVKKRHFSTAESILRKIPGLDVTVMPADSFVELVCNYPENYYSAVKYGRTLIDKNHYRQKILVNQFDYQALKNKIKESGIILSILESTISLCSETDILPGCCISLWFRYKGLYGIKCLLMDTRCTKAQLYSEAEKFGVRADIMRKVHIFYKYRNSISRQQEEPTKKLLLPVLKAANGMKAEIENLLSQIDSQAK